MSNPPDVNVIKDQWDWLLFVLSAGAAFTAILVFLPWALERRRRPEVRVMWQLSRTSEASDLKIWHPHELVEIRPGEEILILAAALNVGDRAGDQTLINFVVPEIFSLVNAIDEKDKPLVSHHATAGLKPGERAKYLSPSVAYWASGDWFACHYLVRLPDDHVVSEPFEARLLFTIGNQGFNRSGWRWLPSFGKKAESLTSPAGQEWPPRAGRGRFWTQIRWVHAQPIDRILSFSGERQDVRDVRIVPHTPDESRGT